MRCEAAQHHLKVDEIVKRWLPKQHKLFNIIILAIFLSTRMCVDTKPPV